MPNITVIRRHNAVTLFQDYATARIAAGEPAKGLEQAFAAQLQISPSMWSQIKSSRPISDKLARQIEGHTQQPSGWLDTAHGSERPDPAQERFLALALAAWHASNAQAKRELMRLMRERAIPNRSALPTFSNQIRGQRSHDANAAMPRSGPAARHR